MEAVLNAIIKSHKLPQYISELQQVLKKEKQHRIQFYNSISEDDKAEYINGEIILHSPVMLRHNLATSFMSRVFSTYADLKDLGIIGIEKCMIELSRNSYEPDIVFWKNDKAEKFTAQQKIFPVPDFIIEVLSDSTEKNDRGIKFEDYALHCVKEYWIVDPIKETIEQYLLQNGVFELELKSKEGYINCQVLKGLAFYIPAAFNKKDNVELQKSII
ncbi:MAG: Uma2 family endonuclease [Flavobacterium sp.]|nr:Uma2 family endonuclease [Flavobacterium sp.]